MRFIAVIALLFIFPFAAANESVAEAPEIDADVMASGEAIYLQHCVICHQPAGTGMGTLIPPLAGNDELADARWTLDTIVLSEGHALVIANAALDAERLAHVATYIRNAWENEFGDVSVDEAAAFLDEVADDLALDAPAAELPAVEEEPATDVPAEEVSPDARFVAPTSTPIVDAEGLLLGQLTLGTEVRLVDNEDGRKQVVLEGWAMEAGPAAVFHSMSKRIALASLTEEGQEAREILDEEQDDFGTVWLRFSLRGWVTETEDVAPTRTAIWEAGETLNTQACGGCHVVYEADQFTVNQWPGTIRTYVPAYVSLTDDELELLTKYLQYNARDW